MHARSEAVNTYFLCWVFLKVASEMVNVERYFTVLKLKNYLTCMADAGAAWVQTKITILFASTIQSRRLSMFNCCLLRWCHDPSPSPKFNSKGLRLGITLLCCVSHHPHKKNSQQPDISWAQIFTVDSPDQD